MTKQNEKAKVIRMRDRKKRDISALSADSLLTATEVAKVLFVEANTLRCWAASGKIPCIRIGEHLIRFRKGDIDSYLQRNYNNGSTADGCKGVDNGL